MFRLTVALAAALALPAVAAADVRIVVPPSLLGGRVAPANPLPPPDPADAVSPNDADAGEVDLTDPDFWSLVWPSSALALAAPDEIVFDCDEDLNPGSCGLWGAAATGAGASAASIEAAVAAPVPESTVAASRRLRPALGTWMASQTPRLRWTPARGATHYNIQIFLGRRRVASAWTTRPRLLIPPRVIDQGRYYMWSVWPAFGPRTKPAFGEPLGRSVFGVILRPRIVFHSTATGVQGEIRPRIPGGLLALSGPGSIASRIPKRIHIGSNSRFNLRVTRREAEHVTARLLDSGPRPPKGLRPPA
jgi:hypothetical protein